MRIKAFNRKQPWYRRFFRKHGTPGTPILTKSERYASGPPPHAEEFNEKGQPIRRKR